MVVNVFDVNTDGSNQEMQLSSSPPQNKNKNKGSNFCTPHL